MDEGVEAMADRGNGIPEPVIEERRNVTRMCMCFAVLFAWIIKYRYIFRHDPYFPRAFYRLSYKYL